MMSHKWSYLLSFLDLEGEADTVSIDIIWIWNLDNPLVYEMFPLYPFTWTKWLLNQWSKEEITLQRCSGGQLEWKLRERLTYWGKLIQFSMLFLSSCNSVSCVKAMTSSGDGSSINKPAINYYHNDLNQPAEPLDVCSTPRIKMQIWVWSQSPLH